MLPSKLQWGFTSATLMPESSSCCPRWRCHPSPSTPPDLPNPHARAWVHPVEDEGALCLHRIRTSADPPAAILDRKRFVQGKRGKVRFTHGGARIHKKKK